MSITIAPIETQEAMDASSILAELAVSPDEPSVLRAAADVLPRLGDKVRRLTAPAGTEDDDLLALARSVGVVIERTR
ncbi:hypothetical protein [Streptomyces sp. CB03238]|uniref:hypothetical protein n=1 Tax=Streptomyces sp. CB03238 TaxID=1907777 RepID=UPI000A11A089|nr:hypothetical protein [Streptomyces sp. CB03238]ORT54202.1 hypothetical protein BKD26_36020 [Streptomyces sp. CB03238]